MIGHENPLAGGAGPNLPAELVQEQLTTILRSRTFAHAPVLSRLLEFLVNHSIHADVEQLKEYSVGIEALGRKSSFDPRTDTIVRVHARRLRSKLDEYYKAEGPADPVIIQVPKGGYLAIFRAASPLRNASAARLAGPSRRAFLPRPRPLPAQRTRLIGRQRELASIREILLSDNSRLVTLTGPGGSGKTRLALQAAADLGSHFPGGVYFAALASIGDAAAVVPSIAELLGVRQTGGKPLIDALQEHLRVSVPSPFLLLLDNFEHLLTAAPLLTDLLDACAPLKILVTSRAILHLYGEHECPVPPLAVPELKRRTSPEELSRNPAVALFTERAAAIAPGFVLNAENALDVAEICLRLDGLPLAIELAAARVRMLAPAALLPLLENRLQVLTDGPVDVPARQQALSKTIEWSYELLSCPEQKLFRRLSVFSGGCTLESAEAVADTRQDLGIDLLAGMTSLVDKSLLQHSRDELGEDRFLMLETIREYGLERLEQSGESEAARRAHAAYCLVLAEESDARFSAPERVAWLARCEAEHDNLRAATEWLIQTGDAGWATRIGLALFGFWEQKEHLAEGRQLLEAIANMSGAAARTGGRARLLSYAGAIANSQGDWGPDQRRHRESLDIYREIGDRKGIAAELNALGVNESFRGNYPAARTCLEECLSICRELGDRPQTAAALSNLAGVVRAQRDHSFACSLLEEALATFREIGDQVGVAWSFNHLGDVALDRGDFVEARRCYETGADLFRGAGESWGVARSSVDLGYLTGQLGDHASAHSLFREGLNIFLDLGHRRGIVKALEGFASSAAQTGERRRALTLAGAASALRHAIGAPARPVEKAKLDAILEPVWRCENANTARAAWEAGWNMMPNEAIEFALRGSTAASPVAIQNSPGQ